VIVLEIFGQTMLALLEHTLLARPVLFGSLIAAVFALAVTVSELLERRGWRATAWGAVSACLFGLFLAIAPEGRAVHTAIPAPVEALR